MILFVGFVRLYLFDLFYYMCLMPNLKKCIFSSISSLPSQLLPWFHLIAKRFISNEIFCQKLWKAFQIVQLVFNHHSWTKKLNKHPAELAHVPISLKQVSPKGSPITQLFSQKFYLMAIRGLSKWSHKITFGNELFCELKFGKWGQKFDYFGLEVSNLITCDWILVSAR